jgi:hypothetical protein
MTAAVASRVDAVVETLAVSAFTVPGERAWLPRDWRASARERPVVAWRRRR